MKKGIAITIVVLLLLIAITAVIGIGSKGFKNWDIGKWFEKADTEQTSRIITADITPLTYSANSMSIGTEGNLLL